MALSSSPCLSFLFLLTIICSCLAFVPTTSSSPFRQAGVATLLAAAADASSSSSSNTEESVFEISVNMPPSNSGLRANLRFDSVVPPGQKSEIVEVRYKIPFGLDVAPNGAGLAICTKDGAGGERVGDILRYTSQWTLGLPQGDGLLTQAAAFSGGLSWQCSMFNVMKAKEWGQVVEALVSNEPSRTDEVVLLFERPLEQ